VGYAYDMGKYEVTAGQYTEFLNKVGGVDPLELSGGISGNYTLTVLGTLNATTIEVDTLCIGSVGANAVPEPGSFAMLLSITAGGLLWWKRRKT
jgi:hypothetical protein